MIDVNGNRVRIEEYIIRPTPTDFKLVVLNGRADRFDYGFPISRLGDPSSADRVLLYQLSIGSGVADIFRELGVKWRDSRLDDTPIDPVLSFLGAVGALQFDVVAYRLQHEYGVDCTYEAVNVNAARWVECDDPKRLEEFKAKNESNLAIDHAGDLVYIAPTRVNLHMAQERWKDVRFLSTREHGDYTSTVD
ncbi:MAG: hypothetical protein B7Z82_08930 [Halothiobacillus sp. 20-54-6]|nr:MAG: hypothetical protein B7Z82_08930 [Halothiobacillus sp. 20-54-6]